MFFIVSGQVQVEVRTAAWTTPRRKTLTVLQSGEFFGELSLFDWSPRSASAVAAAHLSSSSCSFQFLTSTCLMSQNSDAALSVLSATTDVEAIAFVG